MPSRSSRVPTSRAGTRGSSSTNETAPTRCAGSPTTRTPGMAESDRAQRSTSCDSWRASAGRSILLSHSRAAARPMAPPTLGVPGRHRLEMAELAVKDSDAHGPENLVAGERVEIAIEVLNVDIDMGHGLGAVHDNGGSVLVSHIDHELDGIHGAQGVRDMPERHQLGAAGKQLFVGFEPQF